MWLEPRPASPSPTCIWIPKGSWAGVTFWVPPPRQVEQRDLPVLPPLTFVSLPHFSAAKFLSGGLCWECLGGGSPQSAWAQPATSPLSVLEGEEEGKPPIAESGVTAKAAFCKPDRSTVLGEESISQTQRWRQRSCQDLLSLRSAGLSLGECLHKKVKRHRAGPRQQTQRLPLPSQTCSCLLGLLYDLKKSW